MTNDFQIEKLLFKWFNELSEQEQEKLINKYTQKLINCIAERIYYYDKYRKKNYNSRKGN